MISFEHALSKLLFLANRIDVEEVDLEEAYSRVLANEAIASRDQPPLMHPQWTVMRSKK